MSSDSDTRRFEYKDEKSSKFWEISVAGNGFTVRYGKIGTDGQTQTKEFADAAAAEKHAQKMIAEKTGKGYLEVGADAKPSATKPSAQPAEATKTGKPTKSPKPAAISVEKDASKKECISDLVEAIKSGDADLVASLLDRGFNPNTRFGFGREFGMTPLHLAVESAYWGMSNHAFLKVVPMLFEATEKKTWGFGRLKGENDQEEKLLRIISILLAKGADPLAINGAGGTPLEVKYAIGDYSRNNALFSRLHATLVPPSGSTPTVQGELLRVVRKLGHERWGNGWCNLIDSAYELELDYLHNFFNGPDAATVFSESELKWSRLAVSMAFLVAYEESGTEPTYSSIGKELLQNKKTIRSGWKRACSEQGGDVFSSEPFEAVEDFCIEYCRRQPLIDTPLTSIFEATLTATPVSTHPELLDELLSQATNAWLAVMASVTNDQQVIDRLIRNEDAPGRASLGCNPHLVAKHIDVLARNDVNVLLLASNPAVAANKLNAWAKDENSDVRKAVAANPATQLSTLIKLSKDTELEVQQAAQQEISKREGAVVEHAKRRGLAFGNDPESLIRLALISNDVDAFARQVNGLYLPESLSQMLTLVFAIPLSAERRLTFASQLLDKSSSEGGDFIGPLIDSFIADLSTKGADGEVAATRDLLLMLIVPGCSLSAVSSEQQCKLYDFHRKGRQEASDVLYALVDQAMPIRHLPRHRARSEKDGASFLEKAIYNGDIDLVSRVVHSDRKSVDDEAGNTLSIAVTRKNQEMIDLLLSDGPDRYASAKTVERAISAICYPEYGNPKGVDSLHKLIAVYRSMENEEAVTTMMFEHLCGAVENGYPDLVEELIRNGAPVDHRTGKVTWGDLLGSFFEMNPKDKVFIALVNAGLDLNAPAADRYRKDIEKILKRAKL